jgi:hypothetical protein
MLGIMLAPPPDSKDNYDFKSHINFMKIKSGQKKKWFLTLFIKNRRVRS